MTTDRAQLQDLSRNLVRWVVLGAASGVAAGVVSFVFLEGLDLVTRTRVERPGLLWLLPLAGLALGLFHHHFGGQAVRGNRLLFAEILSPQEFLPRRMAPLVLVGTWITHLFGGSAGREGTALQMSGSLTDNAARWLGLGGDERARLLAVSVAAGFGSVFGVPLAATVFALEVHPRRQAGMQEYVATAGPTVLPALCAALVGHLVVLLLGHDHAVRPQVDDVVTGGLVLRLAALGLACGAVAWVFKHLTETIRDLLVQRIPWSPLRPALGGASVVGLAVVFGNQYLGLSLPLLDDVLTGAEAGVEVFALKLIFTAVTVGSGFPGGEVTPLFVIGATLGGTLAGPLGLPVVLAGAVGLAAVFAGASRTPLACAIMAAELFGWSALVPASIVCAAAYLTGGRRGLYTVVTD